MNTLSSSAAIFAQAFSFALLSSLWQGASIAGALFLSFRVFKRISPHTRYLLSFAGLLALVLWFADTLLARYLSLSSSVVYVSDLSTSSPLQGHVQTSRLVAATGGVYPFSSLYGAVVSYMPLILSLYMVGLLVMVVRFAVNLRTLQQLTSPGHHNCARTPHPVPQRSAAAFTYFALCTYVCF